MKVSDVMSSHCICVRQDEPVSAAALLLRRHNLGALPVCTPQGQLRGMITDRDIALRCVAGDLDPRETRISEVMSRGIQFVSPQDSAETALEIMSREQLRRLPVAENGKPVGMVSLCDLVRNGNFREETASALFDISSNVRRFI